MVDALLEWYQECELPQAKACFNLAAFVKDKSLFYFVNPLQKYQAITEMIKQFDQMHGTC